MKSKYGKIIFNIDEAHLLLIKNNYNCLVIDIENLWKIFLCQWCISFFFFFLIDYILFAYNAHILLYLCQK